MTSSSSITNDHPSQLSSERIDIERDSLASLLRLSVELYEYTGVEIVLSEKTISEFFEEVDE